MDAFLRSQSVAFILIVFRLGPISSFLCTFPHCKHGFARLTTRHHEFTSNRLHQCWASSPTQQEGHWYRINGGYAPFKESDEAPPLKETTDDPPTYRLPDNLTNDEIRSLKPDERFRYRIRQLLEYKAENGHLNVKRSENQGLCNWIVTQRHEYRMYTQRATRKDSFLTKERIEQLTKIGFDWRTEEKGLTPSWMKWHEKLSQYEQQHGHVRVSKDDDPALHKWVCNQRQLYSRWKRGVGPSAGMTQARCDKLEALGMVWSMREAGLTEYDNQWKQRLKELIAFNKKHGHLMVPRQEPLGEWTAHQRKQYKDKMNYNVSALTEEREMQLREIGFDFDGKRSWMKWKWQERYSQLESFYKEHHHLNVPKSESRLRNWVQTQRTEYKRLKAGKPSAMTQQNVAALEKLGFEWDLRLSKWMEQYQKLRDFHAQYNSTFVPTNFPEDPSFGTWVRMQRSYYRKAKLGEEPGHLSDEQMRLLDDISFLDSSNARNYEAHSLSWDKMIHELILFKAEHGHCRVSSTRGKHYSPLGTWVAKQKRQYELLQANRNSSLTPERIEELEKIGFEWSVEKRQRQNETWFARLQELKEFKEEYGNFVVPADYENPKLSNWYRNTRQQYRLFKEGKPTLLSPARVEALDAIGFDGGLGHDDSWNSFLNELKQFHAVHGHCRVPLKFADNPKLGRWVNRHRAQYQYLKKGKPSSLTPERIRLLEALDFEWVVSRGKK